MPHRRLAVPAAKHAPQSLEAAPVLDDLDLERQPRARTAEVVDLEARRRQAVRHAAETPAAAHDALEQHHRVGSRASFGLRHRRQAPVGTALACACAGPLIRVPSRYA
jgi:hypothetical protein